MITIKPLTPEEQMNKLVTDATALVEVMIQDVIDKYNAENKLVFKDVDSLYKYTKNPTYKHYQFCSDVIDWVTSDTGIWEVARTIQEEVFAGKMPQPTIKEFKAMLPPYKGVI